MKRFLSFICLLSGTAALGYSQNPAAGSPSPDTVVLRLGDKAVTRAEFDQWGQLILRNYSWDDSATRMAVLASFGRSFSLGEEARRRGIDKDPQISIDIQNRTNQILANGLFAAVQKELSADEAGTRRYYESRKEQFAEPRVRQVLIGHDGAKTKPRAGRGPRTETQARQLAEAIHKRLAAGEDFAKIAGAESDDSATAAKGGDMGHIRRGQTVSQFEEAAYAAPVGKISAPFKSEYGYHVIRVDEKIYQPFENMRKIMEYERARAVMDDLVKKLVQPDPAYFPAQAPAQASPAK